MLDKEIFRKYRLISIINMCFFLILLCWLLFTKDFMKSTGADKPLVEGGTQQPNNGEVITIFPTETVEEEITLEEDNNDGSKFIKYNEKDIRYYDQDGCLYVSEDYVSLYYKEDVGPIIEIVGYDEYGCCTSLDYIVWLTDSDLYDDLVEECIEEKFDYYVTDGIMYIHSENECPDGGIKDYAWENSEKTIYESEQIKQKFDLLPEPIVNVDISEKEVSIELEDDGQESVEENNSSDEIDNAEMLEHGLSEPESESEPEFESSSVNQDDNNIPSYMKGVHKGYVQKYDDSHIYFNELDDGYEGYEILELSDNCYWATYCVKPDGVASKQHTNLDWFLGHCDLSLPIIIRMNEDGIVREMTQTIIQ